MCYFSPARAFSVTVLEPANSSLPPLPTDATEPQNHNQLYLCPGVLRLGVGEAHKAAQPYHIDLQVGAVEVGGFGMAHTHNLTTGAFKCQEGAGLEMQFWELCWPCGPGDSRYPLWCFEFYIIEGQLPHIAAAVFTMTMFPPCQYGTSAPCLATSMHLQVLAVLPFCFPMPLSMSYFSLLS